MQTPTLLISTKNLVSSYWKLSFSLSTQYAQLTFVQTVTDSTLYLECPSPSPSSSLSSPLGRIQFFCLCCIVSYMSVSSRNPTQVDTTSVFILRNLHFAIPKYLLTLYIPTLGLTQSTWSILRTNINKNNIILEC